MMNNNRKRRRKNMLNLEGSNLDATNDPSKNGLQANSLTHLLEQYNSSDDDSDNTCLNDKVNDFFKEIQDIAPKNEEIYNQNENKKFKDEHFNQPVSLWQECFDETTGYPYYWHVETNAVTWEIPEELEQARKNTNNTEIPKSTDSKWSSLPRNIPSNLSTNIPEGMIPKDVVARSRNRHQKVDTKRIKTLNKNKIKSKNKTDQSNDSSDEGRIEMITSFGDNNDNSDSDDSDDENDNIKSNNLIKKSTPLNSSNNNLKVENSSDNLRTKKIKNGGIDNENETDNKTQVNVKSSKSEDSEMNSLKTLDIKNSNSPNNEVSDNDSQQFNVNNEKEIKFSLVPEYIDDKDDDNATNKPVEPLFPICSYDNTRYTEKETKVNSNTEESIHLQNPDSQESIKDEENRIKMEEGPKVNKFIENLGTSTKGFQRKRRIAFDVMPKSKTTSDAETTGQSKDASYDSSNVLLTQRGNDSRHGLGFSEKSDSRGSCNSPNEITNTNSSEEKENIVKKYSIGFVKGETLKPNPEVEESEPKVLTSETQNIVEKLKFLSEGSPTASAVQIMNIQLHTLINAWESGDLKDRYFLNWLTGTDKELSRLEKAAAPSGWNCLWDRSQKRYYYENEETGETRWNYPDVIGGAEEMEICMTPPPTEQDDKEKSTTDDTLINDQGFNQNENQNTKSDETKSLSDIIEEQIESSELKTVTPEPSNNLHVPSPPKISSPSPPPPPKICAEDLIKNKKKKSDGQTSIDSSKKTESTNNSPAASNDNEEKDEKDSISAVKIIPPEVDQIIPTSYSHLLGKNPLRAEPLPPGVEQPEIPYTTVPGGPIEASVIFATTAQQQNASIYAAAISDASNLSILGHHPALMHNQLLHYPAYHQHLQNALIAAPNRLPGQETLPFMLDYSHIYANTQVIAKPPVKTTTEPLGSVLDSFYSDIASLEYQKLTADSQQQNQLIQNSLPIRSQPPAVSVTPPAEPQVSTTSINPSIPDTLNKEKKKKKVKIVISKKQKEMSSMVAKWKKAQNFQGNN